MDRRIRDRRESNGAIEEAPRRDRQRPPVGGQTVRVIVLVVHKGEVNPEVVTRESIRNTDSAAPS